MAPLFLLGEVIAQLTTPAVRRAAFTGAAVAVVATTAPFHLGPVAAVVAGLVAGLLTPEARS